MLVRFLLFVNAQLKKLVMSITVCELDGHGAHEGSIERSEFRLLPSRNTSIGSGFCSPDKDTGVPVSPNDLSSSKHS